MLAAIRETLERADGCLEVFDCMSGEGIFRSVMICMVGGECGGEKVVMVDLVMMVLSNELKTGSFAGFIDVVSKVLGVVFVVYIFVLSEVEF